MFFNFFFFIIFGKKSIFIWNELLDNSKKFTIETVMSHSSKLDFMRLAKEKGFKVYLVWVECYRYHFYAVKFHLKNHRYSDNKYRYMTKLNEARQVIHTCINILLLPWFSSHTAVWHNIIIFTLFFCIMLFSLYLWPRNKGDILWKQHWFQVLRDRTDRIWRSSW